MNNIEVFMYALGASFPVLSRYIVQRTDRGHDEPHRNFSSWARYVPDFIFTNFSPGHAPQALSENQPEKTETPRPINKSLHDENDTDTYSGVGASDASDRHMIATPSNSSRTEREVDLDIHGDRRSSYLASHIRDIERGHVTQGSEGHIVHNRSTDESVLKEYIESSYVVGKGW